MKDFIALSIVFLQWARFCEDDAIAVRLILRPIMESFIFLGDSFGARLIKPGPGVLFSSYPFERDILFDAHLNHFR